MNIVDQIIKTMDSNPGKSYTVDEMKAILKRNRTAIQRALSRLVEVGVVDRKSDPSFHCRYLYRRKGGTTFATTFSPPTTFATTFATTFSDPYFDLLYNILYSIKHILKKKAETNLIPEVIKNLIEFDNMLDKFLNDSGRELSSTIPDELWDKILRFAKTEIFPVLRKPVLEKSSDEVSPDSLDPSVKFPESDPSIKFISSTPIPEKTLSEEKSKPRDLPVGNIEKFLKKSGELEKTPAIRLSKEMRVKEDYIAENVFTPHVRYFRLTPEQRSFEFAKAWMKIVTRFFKGYRMNPGYQKALTSPALFRKSGKLFSDLNKARIEADLLNARYEDYMVGIAELQFDLNARSSLENTPQTKQFAGETHIAAAKDYIEQNLKGSVLITKQDILYSGNANFLLAENYATPTQTAEQFNLAKTFYQDCVFVELERNAMITGHRLWELVTQAIDYGLLPKAWTTGYGTHHTIDKLKGYEPTESYFKTGILFRNVQE